MHKEGAVVQLGHCIAAAQHLQAGRWVTRKWEAAGDGRCLCERGARKKGGALLRSCTYRHVSAQINPGWTADDTQRTCQRLESQQPSTQATGRRGRRSARFGRASPQAPQAQQVWQTRRSLSSQPEAGQAGVAPQLAWCSADTEKAVELAPQVALTRRMVEL